MCQEISTILGGKNEQNERKNNCGVNVNGGRGVRQRGGGHAEHCKRKARASDNAAATRIAGMHSERAVWTPTLIESSGSNVGN